MFKNLYNKFKKLSDVKKVIVVIVSYFILRNIKNIMSWVYWNSGMYILEGFGQPSKFVLFHWKDCGYCKEMMGEWNAFHASNKSSIKSSKIERDDNPALLKKYSIDGFPTILLLDDKGSIIEKYNGERTKDGFMAYIDKKSQ
jgi:thiol-disulfide isomerase/thioredoxin